MNREARNAHKQSLVRGQGEGRRERGDRNAIIVVTVLKRLGAARRAELLRECIPRLLKVSRGWVDAATTAKGLGPLAASEEWLGGPMAACLLPIIGCYGDECWVRGEVTVDGVPVFGGTVYFTNAANDLDVRATTIFDGQYSFVRLQQGFRYIVTLTNLEDPEEFPGFAKIPLRYARPATSLLEYRAPTSPDAGTISDTHDFRLTSTAPVPP